MFYYSEVHFINLSFYLKSILLVETVFYCSKISVLFVVLWCIKAYIHGSIFILSKPPGSFLLKYVVACSTLYIVNVLLKHFK